MFTALFIFIFSIFNPAFAGARKPVPTADSLNLVLMSYVENASRSFYRPADKGVVKVARNARKKTKNFRKLMREVNGRIEQNPKNACRIKTRYRGKINKQTVRIKAINKRLKTKIKNARGRIRVRPLNRLARVTADVRKEENQFNRATRKCGKKKGKKKKKKGSKRKAGHKKSRR